MGASRSRRKFGNTILRDLKNKGYQVFPVNPNAESVEGMPCFPGLLALPAKVDGVVFVVPPSETEKVVQDLVQAQIPRVWMQQGAESEKALQFCRENGIQVVTGECIIMFAPPVAFLHKLHRRVWGLPGKLPK